MFLVVKVKKEKIRKLLMFKTIFLVDSIPKSKYGYDDQKHNLFSYKTKYSKYLDNGHLISGFVRILDFFVRYSNVTRDFS